MTSQSSTPTPVPNRRVRGEIHVGCGFCDEKTFKGDDLTRLARRAAKHINREHGDQYRHHMEPFDTLHLGGDSFRAQGREYVQYERLDLYITSFDVLDRFGHDDGLLVPADEERTCPECYHVIPRAEDRLEDNPDDQFDDSWTCRMCRRESAIERRQSENRAIGEFEDGGEQP